MSPVASGCGRVGSMGGARVGILGIGSISTNRTVAGDDLRLRWDPTEVDDFKLDFMDSRFGCCPGVDDQET